MIDFSTPPAADEIEVSLFGPGKGEAIAVHLGDGEWMTVDSCVNSDTGENILLEYFAEMGQPLESISTIVGTHAHDDHIAGIADLFEACGKAKFVCSSALVSEEFIAHLEMDADLKSDLRLTILDEYRRVFDQVKKRGKATGFRSLVRGLEGLPIVDRVDGALRAKVVALSPSHHAVTRAQTLLAEGVAHAGERRRFKRGDPNIFAVALWLEVGDATLLLGADLLTGPSGCGWQAVVSSGPAIAKKAEIIKVPHHGSSGAHHQPAWDALVSDRATALIAPYRALRRPIPTDEDLLRVKDAVAAVYVAAPSRRPAMTNAERKSVAALGRVVNAAWKADGVVGHVRARRRIAETQWAVECRPPARAV